MKTFSKIITDESLRETALHGNSEFPFKYYLENIWDFDFHCIDWHWHPEVEFIYVRSGAALCHIGNTEIKLSKGSGLFINSRAIHQFRSECETVIPNIVFSPKLLAEETGLIYKKYIKPVTDSDPQYLIFTPDTDGHRDVLDRLCHVFSYQDAPCPNELDTVIALLEMWEIMYHRISDDLPQRKTDIRTSDQAKLQIMMQFIHDHFSEPITLHDISKSVNVSESTALAVFKNSIHVSPVEYMINYRLKFGAALLTDTEKKILTIAEESGFKSSEYFCRSFKRLYQMTPNEYRKYRNKMFCL